MNSYKTHTNADGTTVELYESAVVSRYCDVRIDPSALVGPCCVVRASVGVGAELQTGATVDVNIPEGCRVMSSVRMSDAGGTEVAPRSQIIGGRIAGYTWAAWKTTDGSAGLRFGCVAADVRKWQHKKQSERNIYEPEEAKQYARLTRALAQVARVAADMSK